MEDREKQRKESYKRRRVRGEGEKWVNTFFHLRNSKLEKRLQFGDDLLLLFVCC